MIPPISTFGGTSGDGDASPRPFTPPDIPGFTMGRLLGQGGMGAVYEAWQDKPHRRVAIKWPHPGSVSLDALQRINIEADILGRLEHPAIARIYAAGSVQVGAVQQPYLVLEFIEGQSITGYAEQAKLTVDERLRLFLQVVEGVHFAHQQGILHRDLKPANILVDTRGQPKILDFGIAWVSANRSLPGEPPRASGTTAYMAPEQLDGHDAVIDLRADVYALGLVLFELLTGEFPYRLDGVDRKEIARMILEQAPAPLCSVNPALNRDLGFLVAKAIDKDRDRRYASAAALAEDVRRYLTHFPLNARPYSSRHAVAKFARRHRGIVAVTAALVVAIIAGLVSTSIGWRRALIEEQRAETNFRRALDTIDQFTLFIANSQLSGVPGTDPVRDRLLSDAVFLYENLLAENPDDSALAEQVAWAYAKQASFEADAGDVSKARRALERQIELTRQALTAKGGAKKDNQRSLAYSTFYLARVMARLGDKPAAHERFIEAERLLRDLVASGGDFVLQDQFNLAYLLGSWGQILNDPREQKAKYEEALSMWRTIQKVAPGRKEVSRAIAWNETRLSEITWPAAAPAEPAKSVPAAAMASRDTIGMIDALDLDAIRKAIGRHVQIRGRVQEVAMNRGRDRFTYVNFGRGTDAFFGTIHRNSLPKFIEMFGENLEALMGRDVVLGGVVSVYRNRPELALNQPAQVRVIDDPTLKDRAIPVIDAKDVVRLREEAGRMVVLRGRIEEVGVHPNHQLTYLQLEGMKGLNTAVVIQQFNARAVLKDLGLSSFDLLVHKTIEVTGRVYFFKQDPNVEVSRADEIRIMD